MGTAFTVFRYAVFAGVAFLAVSALGVMLVQRRTLSPFGALARAIRRTTDPLLKPIERRVLRAGGNPQSAPWWMLGVAVLGGILLISAAEWGMREAQMVRLASQGGARPVAHLVAGWAFSLLSLALIVRVVGSWLGATEYTPWMRPFVLMTEWFLGPLRRVLPRFGPFDLSPLVAWLVISWILRPLVLGLL